MFEIPESIRYRIPGKEKVHHFGTFRPLEEGETPEGFVVTDFKGEKTYWFDVRGEMSQFVGPEQIRETQKSAYLTAARTFIAHLQESGGKAVLSRVKKHEIEEYSPSFFDALCEAYPHAFVYEIFGARFGRWVGATPETLLHRMSEQGSTMALAGTRLTKSDAPWTDKEFEEHELVADFIEDTLKNEDIEGIKRSPREEVVSGPVKHLHTAFYFRLRKDKEWQLARTLHPTPAVSGWPVEDALNLIHENEAHDRSFYAGIIGVVAEETHLFVNLRCAQVIGDSMFLYLGGGLTKDSDPEAEWEETENKAKTLLDVLKNT